VSITPVSATSATRPSISALVSSRNGRVPLAVFLNSTYGMMNRKSSFVWSVKLTVR
jgi:hypothetical protein